MRFSGRRSPKAFSLSLALLLGGAAAAPVAAQLLGPEFQINTYTTNSQVVPAVAASPGGNFVVTWQSWDQDGAGFGPAIFGQRFDDLGLPDGEEFQINPRAEIFPRQQQAVVGMDDDADFVVSWRAVGGLDEISARRFDADGTPMGDSFIVYTQNQRDRFDPAVSASAGGDFFVVWQALDHYEPYPRPVFAVNGRRYDADGVPLGDELVIRIGFEVLAGVDVAATLSGEFVVARGSCSDEVPPPPDGACWLTGRRYDPANPLGTDFDLGDTTDEARQPALAADGSGNFVVVWESPDRDGSFLGVFGRRFAADGTPRGASFQVNTFTTGDQWQPRVAASESGGFLVVWNSLHDGSSSGVFGQRFSAAGTRIGGEFRINAYTWSSQARPRVAAVGPNDFVVVWSSPQDGSEEGVFGRRIRSGVFHDDFETGDACAWSATVGGGCP